jgi:hypothetical protein
MPRSGSTGKRAQGPVRRYAARSARAIRGFLSDSSPTAIVVADATRPIVLSHQFTIVRKPPPSVCEAQVVIVTMATWYHTIVQKKGD